MQKRSQKPSNLYFALILLFIVQLACSIPTPISVRNPCNASVLIDAINNANATSEGTTIALVADCTYLLTEVNNYTDGANGLPSIRSSITIIGSDSTISRDTTPSTPTFRIFHVSSEGNLTLDNVSISGGDTIGEGEIGSDKWGGAIYNLGSLNLVNSEVSENFAFIGAGIFNSGVTVIQDSLIFGNRASGSAGGIGNRGVLTILGSQIYSNTAIHSRGGGIENLGDLNISDSQIYSNEAYLGAGLSNDEGCSIRIEGSDISENVGFMGAGISNMGILEISNSTLSVNNADFLAGGIINQGELHLTGSTISGNSSARWGGGIINGEQALAYQGGGMTQIDPPSLELDVGPADTTIDSVVDCLDGIVVLDGEGEEIEAYNMTAQAEADASCEDEASATPLPEPELENYCGNEILRGMLSIRNSTISGNQAGLTVGGILNHIGGELTIMYSTLTGNGAEGGGGGVVDESAGLGSIEITNSIIANNTPGEDCFIAPGMLVATSNNLDSDGSCEGFSITDNPVLGPLQDNGGQTATHALLEGSPAIDAASGICIMFDQRAMPRPFAFGDRCDLGAYEDDSPIPLIDPPPELIPEGMVIPGEVPGIVVVDTLCTLGPGSDYPTVSSLVAGISVQLLGVGAQYGWLVVDNPRYPGVSCWVPEDDLDVPTDIDLTELPEFEIPAIPEEIPDSEEPPSGSQSDPTSAPAAPSGLQMTTTCASPVYSVKLTWNDNSNNESGFRIYRNGTLIGTVGPNTTQFTDSNPPGSGPQNYTVRAYNSAGESAAVAASDAGCIF